MLVGDAGTCVMKGFNGSFMAFGQKGSGKTHTMFGNDGLLSLSVEYLFRQMR